MLSSPENRGASFLTPYSPPQSRALETPSPHHSWLPFLPLQPNHTCHLSLQLSADVIFPFLVSKRPGAGPHNGSAIMSVGHSQSFWTSPLPSIPHSGPFPLRSIPSWVWGKPHHLAFLPTSLMPSPVGLPLPVLAPLTLCL